MFDRCSRENTGTRRLCKDTVYSKKEIASQEARIEKVKADEGKDEHDVRKQGEVLQEYVDGLKDELDRLDKALDTLKQSLGELQENQSADMMEKLKLTEEWGKAETAVVDGKAVLKANGREVDDDEAAAGADDEDDTVY